MKTIHGIILFLLSGMSCFFIFWSILLGLSYEYTGGALCGVGGVFFAIVYTLVKNSPPNEKSNLQTPPRTPIGRKQGGDSKEIL
jgi:hypothetical protein